MHTAVGVGAAARCGSQNQKGAQKALTNVARVGLSAGTKYEELDANLES